MENVAENLGTITLSTTSGLEEIIGDFSEGLMVNGVLVKVTDSTNFAVKNDDENIYIETTAPDVFTIIENFNANESAEIWLDGSHGKYFVGDI